ncbi:hypothetical protein [Variovorax paradoxus]
MKSSTPAIDPRSSAASIVPCFFLRSRSDFCSNALLGMLTENRR